MITELEVGAVNRRLVLYNLAKIGNFYIQISPVYLQYDDYVIPVQGVPDIDSAILAYQQPAAPPVRAYVNVQDAIAAGTGLLPCDIATVTWEIGLCELQFIRESFIQIWGNVARVPRAGPYQ